MTIGDAVALTDSRMMGNQYSYEDKVRWLSLLDKRIFSEVVSRRADSGISEFNGYSASSDPQTELLVSSGYDDVYIYYLEAMINKANCEYSRYNNSMIMFNTLYSLYKRHYNRTHRIAGHSITTDGGLKGA